MKRIKLVKKIKKKKQHVPLKTKIIYFNGFCATDNKNFALFNINNQFLVDRGYTQVLSFKLTEHAFPMIIDRDKKLKLNKEIKKVSFENYGFLSAGFLGIVLSLYSNCSFYPVVEWFGKKSNRLIVGLPNKEGKPIGILKTII